MPKNSSNPRVLITEGLAKLLGEVIPPEQKRLRDLFVGIDFEPNEIKFRLNQMIENSPGDEGNDNISRGTAANIFGGKPCYLSSLILLCGRVDRLCKQSGVDDWIGPLKESEHYTVETTWNPEDANIFVQYADMAALTPIAAMDNEAYGEDSIDEAGLRRWWQKYQAGVYALRMGEEIVGAIGLWPITEDAYEKIQAGVKKDYEIDTDDVVSLQPGVGWRHWYAGDIIIRRDLRYKDGELTKILVSQSLSDFLASGALAPNARFCSIITDQADTRDSRRLLRMFGFEAEPNHSDVLTKQFTNISKEMRHGVEFFRKSVLGVKRRHPYWHIDLSLPKNVALEPVTIRPMNLGDLDVVTDIFTAIYSGDYVSFTEIAEGKASAPGIVTKEAPAIFRRQIVDLIDDEAEHAYLVAEASGTVIGFGFASIHPTESGGSECWIDDLGVLPAWQKRGVAKSLISALTNWATIKGADYFLLESGVNNHSAHAVFERLGFQLAAHVYWRSAKPTE